MASDPYPDLKRGIWRMKYRPDPSGGWVTVNLGKDPRLKAARPPKTPPQFVIDRAAEFAEQEYRVKHGLSRPLARARGLASYLENYVESQAKVNRKNSGKQLRRHVDSFLRFCEDRGVKTVQGVTKVVCRDYLAERIGQVAPSTLRTERGYLIGAFTQAEEIDELISSNPWRGVSVPKKVVDSTPTFWTSDEIARIVTGCKRQLYKDLVMILANTGLRISTALCMRWDWIDWRDGSIDVPEGDEIKTPYVHVMGKIAREILERRQIMAGDADLVFPNPLRAGRIHYDTARDAIDRAINKSGVRAGTPHDLRHSYGRAMALAGVPVTVIQSQLGHSSLSMTMKYVKTDETQAARFVENFEVGRPAIEPPT